MEDAGVSSYEESVLASPDSDPELSVSEDDSANLPESSPANTPAKAAKRLRDELIGKSPAERLQTILLEISDEADALRTSRDLVDDPTVASARRVTALKEMSNIIIQLDRIGMDINLDHPILKVLINYLLDVFVRVLKAQGITQAQVDVIISAMYAETQAWESEVDARYRAYRKDQMLLESREQEKKAEKKDKDKRRERVSSV